MTVTFRRSESERCPARTRRLLGLMALLISLTVQCFTRPVGAQSSPTLANLSPDAVRPVVPLDPLGMQKELTRLDGICSRLGLSAEQALMKDWIHHSEDDSQTFYLPLSRDPVPAARGTNAASADKHASWLKHFSTARQRHAEYWVEQAQQMASAGDEWAAYKLLWRAAREDDAHEPVRRALGPLLSGLSVKSRPKSVNAAHARLQWPAGSYTRVDTANFRLTSRADSTTTMAIASRLENFYALWTQIFYPLWAAPNVASARLAGRNVPWSGRHQFEVILCKDRDDYVKTLGVEEANIGVSVGYYNPEVKMAFFYPDAQLDATLYHELTHQLLSEASQLKPRGEAKMERDFWIVEGVALHAESLQPRGLDWKLGGWLAPRMQTARYRSLHDGYWIDWPALSDRGMEQWKSDPDIARLYSHASGLSHYFLDDRLPEIAGEQNAEKVAPVDTAAAHAAYYFALVGVYQGNRGATDKLLELLGGDQAQRNYVNYLLARDRHLASLGQASTEELQSVRDLVLTRSQLTASSWQNVARLPALEWLDCSFSNVTSADLTWIDQLKHLKRLSLEGTSTEGSILAKVAKLPELTELDLTQCAAIDDQALSALAGHSSLETVWLGGTQISQASIRVLDSMPQLSFVEVSGTRIDKADADALTKRLGLRKR